jgi:hypothetical protein
VDFREAVLVSDDAVAADAHGRLGLTGFDVADWRLGMRGNGGQKEGRACDKEGDRLGQQWFHF